MFFLVYPGLIMVYPGLALMILMGSLHGGTALARSAPKAKAGHDYTKLEEELRFTPGLTARSNPYSVLN